MRTLLVALLVAATAGTAAADGWTNPYSGTTFNNPMSQMADVMISASINNAILQKTIDNQHKQASTPAAPAKHEPITATDFAAGKRRLVVDQVVGALAPAPEQRKALAAGVEQVFTAYEAAVRKNNVAFA